MPKIVDWPTRGLTVEHQGNEWGAYKSESVLSPQLPPHGNLLLRGSLDVALRSLGGSGRRFSAVCIDFPHIHTLEPSSEFGSTSVVMSLCEQIIARLPALMANDGHVLLLCDCWTAPWVLAAIESQADFAIRSAVCWQKRYAGLQDKKGVIDSSFDVIFDLMLGRQESVVYDLIPDAKGFRSQDATQLEQSLLDSGEYGPDVEPSRRAKPARLCQTLLSRTPEGPVLELMSDSGYFAAAALAANREFVCVSDDTTGADPGALKRICARLGGAASEVTLPPVPRVRVGGSSLRTVRFDSVVAARQRAFGVVTLPACPKTDADLAEAYAVVPNDDPFIGIQHHLRRPQAAAALNTNNDRIDLARLISDWFEAAGLHAPCAVRSDLLSCLRLSAWAASTFGLESQAGLITAAVTEKPDWWLVLTPAPKDRKYTMKRQGRYSNPTNDPRGAFREEYKGARSGSDATKRGYNAPPYRFELVSGRFPAGFCQLDKFSGVIHAPKIEEAGRFECEIKVSDSAGNASVATIAINVCENHANATPSDTDIWWLDPPLECGAGPLTTLFPRELRLTVGCSFSFVLQAKGGMPFASLLTPSDRGDERQDRFWPWSRKELVKRMLSLSIGYGRNGTAKFQNRVFKSEHGDDAVTVHSWWGAKNLAKWEVSSVTDGLRSVLCEASGIFVIDGTEGDANPRNIRLRYAASSPTHVRLRLQGVPYPVLAEDVDLAEFLSHLGFIESPTPDAVSGLVRWFGTTPLREELVVALHEDIAPTTARLEQLKHGLREYGELRILVLYFQGIPPSTDGVRFRRIPFDADRC